MNERGAFNSDPQVTKRLFTILLLMIGSLCIFGGYLLGRMSRNDTKRNKDLLTFNLTAVAENLYIKATKISHKTINHYDSEKVRARLVQIFDYTHTNCAIFDKYNLGEFIKNSINSQVYMLMRSFNNASAYLDSLR